MPRVVDDEALFLLKAYYCYNFLTSCVLYSAILLNKIDIRLIIAHDVISLGYGSNIPQKDVSRCQ